MCSVSVRSETHATRFQHRCFPLQKPGCTARGQIPAELIADWLNPGQLTCVTCPIYVSSVHYPGTDTPRRRLLVYTESCLRVDHCAVLHVSHTHRVRLLFILFRFVACS